MWQSCCKVIKLFCKIMLKNGWGKINILEIGFHTEDIEVACGGTLVKYKY